MFRRLINKKGAVPVVTIVLAALLAVATVVIVGFLSNGFGFGGGQGDGEGSGNISTVQSEPDTSEPIIEELDYLNVTVSENEYIYHDSKLQLDELMDKLSTDAAETSVKITDKNASKRAYKNLINALDEKDISYIEEKI